MKLTINEKAQTVTITLPLTQRPSASGKSVLLASTGGNAASGVEFDGREVIVGVNAYIPAKA